MTEVKYENLSDEAKVLLEIEWKESMVSPDISLFLYNCGIAYASNLLRKIWGKGLLKRKKEKKKNGGYRYRYTLNTKGERRVFLLHKAGY